MLESNSHLIAKETKKKLCWDKEVLDAVDKNGNQCHATFRLYIPKWRVPKPCPEIIYVMIESSTVKNNPQHIKEAEVRANPALKENPIVVFVERERAYKNTLRYQPTELEWEIGQPYIPYNFTCDEAEILKLTIRWNKPDKIRKSASDTTGYLAIMQNLRADLK